MDALGEGLVRVPLVDELPLREAEVFAEEILLQALLEVRELSPGGCDRLGDIPRFRLCLLVHVESCDLVREAEPRVHDSGLVELLPEGCNGDGAGVGEVLVPGVLDLQPSVALALPFQQLLQLCGAELVQLAVLVVIGVRVAFGVEAQLEVVDSRLDERAVADHRGRANCSEEERRLLDCFAAPGIHGCFSLVDGIHCYNVVNRLVVIINFG